MQAVPRRRGAVALTVGLTVLVAGCAAEPAAVPSAPPPPPWPVVDHPAVKQISVAPGPLWTNESGPFSGAAQVTIQGDMVLLVGRTEERGDGGVAAVDAATGATKWSIGDFGRLPGGQGATLLITDPEHGMTVVGDTMVVPYYLDLRRQNKTEKGLATLDTRDGQVKRLLPVLSNQDGEFPRDEAKIYGWQANGTIAVATVGPVGPASSPAAQARAKTVGIDIASGAVKWERPGPEMIDLVAITGNVLLGLVGQDGILDTLVGLDPDTGQQRWTLAGRYGRSSVATSGTGGQPAVVDGLAAVGVPGDGARDRVAIVDTNTGAEVTVIPEAEGCTSDHLRLLACGYDDNGVTKLVTVATTDRRPVLSARPVDPGRVEGAGNGAVFLYDRGPETSTAYDNAGNPVVTARLPGRFATISEQYAIMWTGQKAETYRGYAIYRVS